MMNGIEFQDVTKAYPSGFEAVKDISFQVGRGEIFGLLGANGAGKTTLIKMISTLLTPTAGTVRVLGFDTRRRPIEIKKRIGVVPQENNLDQYLTVEKNLVFHCMYHGMARAEYLPEVEKWLRLLGLKEKAGEKVYHLSGGARRKVMIAKAFITAPELLILDEPTSGLDIRMREMVWDWILEYRRQERTVLLSTHYPEEAEQLCTRIGVMKEGLLTVTGRGVQ